MEQTILINGVVATNDDFKRLMQDHLTKGVCAKLQKFYIIDAYSGKKICAYNLITNN